MEAPDDDFTFCQVVQHVDVDDSLEPPKYVPDVSRITLQDDHEASNGVQSGTTTTTTTLSEQPASLKPVLESKDLTSQTQVQRPAEKKKPVARAKVPFEKGYSQMDWLKLTRTEPDLAGLKGRSNRRLISLEEVKQHKSDGSVWTVLKGHVYNISPYMKFHPGGVDMLMKAAGNDCTSLFNKYHAWVNAEFLLEKCLVGVLDSS